MLLYHGSNQYFQRFDQTKARVVNDYYGGGAAYFTSDVDVSFTYSNAMFKKSGGDRYIYEVDINFRKLFDVDKQFPMTEYKKIFKNRNDVELFARGAGLMKAGSDRLKVMYDLEEGNTELTYDQVFKGLSRGMNKTAEAREQIKSLGYDGLRYNGGVNMGARRHDVYIAYHPENAYIRSVYLCDADGRRFKKAA